MRVTLDVPPHLSPESTPTNCERLRRVAKAVNEAFERFSLDRKEKRSTAKAGENEWTRLPLRQSHTCANRLNSLRDISEAAELHGADEFVVQNGEGTGNAGFAGGGETIKIGASDRAGGGAAEQCF